MKEQIDNKPNNSIQKNTIYNTIRTISGILYPLITFPYISRVLGAERVGTVNFGATFVSYFSLITTIGITTYAVRECSKVKHDRHELEQTASEIYSINMCIAFLAYIALLLCLFFVPRLHGYGTLILIQSSSILFTVIGTDWINTAMEDFYFITVRTALFQLLALICMFLFVHSPEHYIYYAITSIIASSGAYVINLLYRRRYCRIHFTLHMKWKYHFPAIFTLILMVLSQHILNNLDVTMLGFWNGDYTVGLYTTAVYITNFITQIVTSIIWVLIPELSKRFEMKDDTAIRDLIRYAASFTLVLGLPCFAGLFTMPKEIIYLIGGAEYVGASNCLRILACSMLLCFVHNIVGNLVLLPANREKQFMYACTAGMIVNAVTNYIFIPKWGINGAALTTLCANIIILIISMVGFPKKYRICSPQKIAMGPFIGTAAVFAVCILCKVLIGNMVVRLLLAIAVSGAAYISILLICRDEFILSVIRPVLNRFGHKEQDEI